MRLFGNYKKNRLESCAQLVTKCNIKHIAFIMDGNGRWATKRSLPREAGHRVGIETFKKVIELCEKLGVNTVTVYAFSTENWKRPEKEIGALMGLLEKYVKQAEDEASDKKIRYVFLGDKSALDPRLAEMCAKLEDITKDNVSTINIALNYGGRAEIVHAVNLLIESGATSVTEADISSRLYTAHSPEPDLIIRTGAEVRLSNFLMWQSAYSELYFSDVLWPDFNESELEKAIIAFSKRKRRYGGLDKK